MAIAEKTPVFINTQLQRGASDGGDLIKPFQRFFQLPHANRGNSRRSQLRTTDCQPVYPLPGGEGKGEGERYLKEKIFLEKAAVGGSFFTLAE
jgi:hypothetical protein